MVNYSFLVYGSLLGCIYLTIEKYTGNESFKQEPINVFAMALSSFGRLQRQPEYTEGPELSIGCTCTVEVEHSQCCTVGPFIRIQETGKLYFLTACQPFLNVSKGTTVSLPAAQGRGKKICGEVKAVINKWECIMLVKIAKECLPTRSKLLYVAEEDLVRTGISNPNLPPFEIGDILDARKLTVETGAKSRILVFGAERLFAGTLEIHDARVKIQEVTLGGTLRDVLLADFSEISNLPRLWLGSAVYLLENNTCLRCFGIMVGQMTYSIAIVPIQDVLEEVGYKIGQTLELETFQDLTGTNSTSILDPSDANIFNQALKRGTGKDNNVRINVVGFYGQGKTSLTRRLLNQSLEGVSSTDGIDVRKCKMKQTEWESLETESEEDECLTRFIETAKLFRGVDQTEENVKRGKRKVPETISQAGQTMNQPDSPGSNTVSNDPSTIHTLATKRPRFSNESTVTEMYNRDIGKDTSFISNYSRQLKDKRKLAFENYLSANIWDFGGQYIYYATHQIFHSREAIYLLVFDLTKDLNKVIIDNDFPGRQLKMKNCLKFWLDSIHAFVGPDDEEDIEGQHSTKTQFFRPDLVAKSEPTVILVGTHKDEFAGDITEKFNEIIKLFTGMKSINHISPTRFAVSNTVVSDEEIDKLRNAIYLLGKEHAERKPIPLKWIPLEIALLKVKKKNIITVEEVQLLNSENDNLVQEEEIKTFLKYHHLKGTLIYFDEEDLEQHVVVNPQYLIDAFRCIVRSHVFWVSNADLQPVWDYMNNTGILEKRLLDAVWKDEPGKDFSRNADILLRFLQKHRILAELLVTDEDGNVKYQGRYMIPSLLKQFCDTNKLKHFHERSIRTRVSLVLHTKNSEVLSNTFERVTAAALAKWPAIQFEDQIMVFQNVCIFILDRQHAGQIELTNRGVQLSVINQCQQDVRSNVCDHFRRYVESVMNNEFQKLKSRQTNKNTYMYYLSCNNKDHDGSGSVNIYEKEEVQSDEFVSCPDNKNHSMECRKGVEEWFPAGKLSDNYKIPTRCVTQKDLVGIAGCLGNNWELLGCMLGVRDVEIERIKMDYPRQTTTCIYHMLQMWQQRKREGATFCELITAIEGCQSLSVDNDGMKNIVDK